MFCQLQRRIHKLWQKHFELVVFYSQMRLAKFQTDSQESIQKILAVQALQTLLGCFKDTVNSCLVLFLCEIYFSEHDCDYSI
ncbi:hypothetical protein FD754_001991 [Muntiacus muntjak]|uniref:Uncharacterized protein n=1 Tax=Muntiacus muntjak TaxID=9888 RepID=A0A5N3WAX3_MUNMU|nr:hypothetical protein FD754_001991 [Muntiacus muntjak]